MNRSSLYVWRNLTDDGSLRSLKYSFGPGTANTLAIRLDDGTWLVVCPALGAPSSVLDDLANDGVVSALLAPNSYHHRGQPEWRLRFPNAVSYAPEGAMARLSKKSPGVPYRPIDDLRKKLPDRVKLVLPEGLKVPDLLIRRSAHGKTAWWMGELFTNSTVDDQIWPLRLASMLFGSGLGYRKNSRPGLVYVKDSAAWIRSVRDILAQDPPALVVPAHGDVVAEDTARRTQALLAVPAS